MKKNLVKYAMILVLVGGGTLVCIYAQKTHFFNDNNEEEIVNGTNEEEEKTEDIGIVTGDDPWKEMDKLVAAQSNKEGVSIKGSIKVIDDNGAREKIIEEERFEYSFVGKTGYQKIGSMEFITGPVLDLVADHTNKFISVSFTKENDKQKTLKGFDIKEFKKIMEDRKASAKITQSGNQKMLTIDNITDPQIQGYRIYYEPETYRINKILIAMVRLSPLTDEQSGMEAPATDEVVNNNVEGTATDETIETYTYYLEVIYSEMKVLGIKEEDFNPENKFIVKTKEKSDSYRIELTPPFINYQLISNMDNENVNDRNE